MLKWLNNMLRKLTRSKGSKMFLNLLDTHSFGLLFIVDQLDITHVTYECVYFQVQVE